MRQSQDNSSKDWIPLVVLPLIVCLLHVLCINNYGYFRDELYYLACSKRLAWGFVDHPPLSVFFLRAVTSIVGDSLAAIRAPVVLASGLTTFVVMATSKRIGATGYGLWLTGACTVLSGMYLVIFSFYSMNAFDILYWAIAGAIMVRLIEGRGPWEWLALGTLFGIAFLNKASVLWLVAGIAFAVLATPMRKSLKSPAPWAGLTLAAIIASPNIFWQIQNHWPTLEFAQNAQKLKLLPIAPWDFVMQQAVVMNLVGFVFIVAAIVWSFRAEQKRWLPLSLAFLLVVAILLVNGRSRVNYLAPAYTLVLPLVGLASKEWFGSRSRLTWTAIAFGVSSPLYLCLGLPWLSPKFMTEIILASPIQPPVEEKGPKSPMQGWSDMFGWEDLAREAKAARAGLSYQDQLQAVVVANNYGEAAAMEHFGVPRVVCGHNSYWLWGHDDWNGQVAVFVNKWPDDVKSMFYEFKQVGSVEAPNAVPEQNGSPVWVARGLKVPVSVFWNRIRKYL